MKPLKDLFPYEFDGVLYRYPTWEQKPIYHPEEVLEALYDVMCGEFKRLQAQAIETGEAVFYPVQPVANPHPVFQPSTPWQSRVEKFWKAGITISDVLEYLKGISETENFHMRRADDDPACRMIGGCRGFTVRFNNGHVVIKPDGGGMKTIIHADKLYSEVSDLLSGWVMAHSEKFMVEVELKNGKKTIVREFQPYLSAKQLIPILETCHAEGNAQCVEHFIADL